MPTQQPKANPQDDKTGFYFCLFIFFHTILWTIGPALTRYSLPHDTLESITWGLQWQLGYHKHPFLAAWLSAGFTQLFGSIEWPIYFLAQLMVCITFFAVWQLAKKILPKPHALLATLLLEGVLFYNINSFNLTPDTLQSPLWALLSLFLYQAITSQKLAYWLLTGLFAALCLCTKYQAALILLPMFLLCLYSPLARISFKKIGIYWALVLFLSLISPHLIWLYQHSFSTLIYAKDVSSDYTPDKNTLSHLSFPLRLFVNAIIDILGLILLLLPFYNKDKSTISLNQFQWHFLLFIGFGPLFLSFFLCVITGDYFPPRWLTPYFFLFGIIAIAYLNPLLSKKRLQQFSVSLILFSTILFGSRILSLTLFPRVESDAFLPNKEIALFLSTLWQDHYHSPLVYVAGSNYLVAMTIPYMHDKPTPYFNWVPSESPWINEADLRKKGALFIWDEGENYTWDNDSRTFAHLPKMIVNRFPALKMLPPALFYRVSDKKPLLIGVAILPPE